MSLWYPARVTEIAQPKRGDHRAIDDRPEHGDAGVVGAARRSPVDDALDAVIEKLGVDTGVVLTVDRSDEHLVAVASRGLEEEVLHGFHLPIGVGFSGRIAAERRPVVVDEVGPGAVVNPLIWVRGVVSMAGVPLIANDMLIGVLHVGSLVSRRFGERDLEVLQEAGADLADFLHDERALADRTAAGALQRSLVPTTPPKVDGIDIATRFIPASGQAIGGDWYDVFELPDGSLGIVMGDVTGSGLHAAVVMGRLRSALRSYALESETPGEALHRLNRKFIHFEPGQLATALYMTISPDRQALAIATAGHLGPLVAPPDRPTEFVSCHPNPPIGVPIDDAPETFVVGLDVGTTVACCTDGLYERRHRHVDDQLDKLRSAVWADAPEVVCGEVMMTMVGSEPVTDDTALLVLRRDA